MGRIRFTITFTERFQRQIDYLCGVCYPYFRREIYEGIRLFERHYEFVDAANRKPCPYPDSTLPRDSEFEEVDIRPAGRLLIFFTVDSDSREVRIHYLEFYRHSES